MDSHMERRGTCRVFEHDGRWHIATVCATGLFGLGPDQWETVTVFGYRQQVRAERKAKRMQRKKYQWWAKYDRKRSERLARAAADDSFVRSNL